MSSLFDTCDMGNTAYKRVLHDNYREYCNWGGEIAVVCGRIDVNYVYHEVALPYEIIVHTDRWIISYGNYSRKMKIGRAEFLARLRELEQGTINMTHLLKMLLSRPIARKLIPTHE